MNSTPCDECGHGRICKYREQYIAFLDGEYTKLFAKAPKFTNLHINCLFFIKDKPIERSLNDQTHTY